MKRLAVVIFIALLLCFLIYLEVTAQEADIQTDPAQNLSSEETNAVARPDISKTIDYALEIICESEGGELKFINKIPVCEGAENYKEYN